MSHPLRTLFAALAVSTALFGCSASGEVETDRQDNERDGGGGGVELPDVEGSVGSG
ncbi:MAG: hypothetical protein WD794_00425 [Mycobacteriales bacterium]